MRFEAVYQQGLELEGGRPVWSWPVGLSDGRTILTLLWREVGGEGLRTVILELSATGEAQMWKPGMGYPAPVIVCALANDDLVGLDLVKTGKIYACAVDGTHRWTIATSVRMDCAIAPQSFVEREGRLHWIGAEGKAWAAELAGPTPMAVEWSGPGVAARAEVHLPHTHFCGDRLYVLDFDPLARISVFQARE